MILAPPEPACQLNTESITTRVPADPQLTDDVQPGEIFCGALDGQTHDDISQDKDTSKVKCDSQECYDQQDLRESEFQIDPLSQSKELNPNECFNQQELREVDSQEAESQKDPMRELDKDKGITATETSVDCSHSGVELQGDLSEQHVQPIETGETKQDQIASPVLKSSSTDLKKSQPDSQTTNQVASKKGVKRKAPGTPSKEDSSALRHRLFTAWEHFSDELEDRSYFCE